MMFGRFGAAFNERYVNTFEGMPTRIAARAADAATDAYWDFQGGPWIARYQRSSFLSALGITRDVERYFDDPHDALAHLRSLPNRYHRREGLRSTCLVTYKDDLGGGGGWYCVEAFASDADEQIDVMIREVARDEGRAVAGWAPENDGDKPRRIGGRRKRRTRTGDNDGNGWADAIAWQWSHPDSSGFGDGEGLL